MESFQDPLDNIIAEIQGTLSDVLPEYEQFVTRAEEGEWDGEEDHGMEYVQGQEEYGEGDEEEQFITEAEWGKDKEEGVGEEQEDPLE